MSPTQRTTTTPFLPKLSLEVRLIRQPVIKWSAVQNEDDYIFQFQLPDIEQIGWNLLTAEKGGKEYLDRLLKIKTPQELVKFMNTYSCPVDLPDAIDGSPYGTAVVVHMGKNAERQTAKYLAPDRGPRSRQKTARLRNYVAFRWSMFIEAQTKIKQAKGLPIPTLLNRHPELKSFFNLETLNVTAERRDGVYYGIVTMSPSLRACYRVIALERLLADVEYRFCERCGDPYEVKSKHDRKYCDNPACGHAVAQQAYRERKKNPK